ncbi:MAG TPA: hypothetical protein VN786_12440 [Acidimicrobiales bacterium]|nr:hypothetical protein [Acidimicrobiales bacterium]
MPGIGYFRERGEQSTQRYAVSSTKHGKTSLRRRGGSGSLPAPRPHWHREEIVRGVEHVLAMDREPVALAQSEDYVVAGSLTASTARPAWLSA